MKSTIQTTSYWIGKILIVGVFLYFGIEGIISPETYSSLIPGFVTGFMNPVTAVMIHGIIETICSLFILFNLGGRWAYYILILSFIGVLISVSGQTQIRDFGILGGALMLLAYNFTEQKSA